MSTTTPSGSHTRRRFSELSRAERRRQLIRALVVPFGVATGLTVLYYTLPLASAFTIRTVLTLALGLLAVVAVLVLQVIRIMRDDYPRLRAVGALAMSLPLFLLIFATVYYLLAEGRASSFTEPLTRTDSLYFTITLFSTVGFGDITPRSELARIVVMLQMLGDLILLGVVGKVILSAVGVGVQRGSSARDQ